MEFSTSDKTSALVNAKLATMIEEIIKGNLPKTKLEELVEKYPRPENCKLLVSPESKQSYLESIVSRYQIQRQGSSESSAAIYFLNLCHYNACDKASDALKAGKRELNLRRRESLEPDLNAQFASLCNHATLITSALLGYDLGKEIDEVSRANKLSRKLSSKRSSRKSYHPYSTQHRQTSSLFSRGGKSYSARPFF